MPTNISIQIAYALYGIKDRTIEVTKEAQAALAGDDLTVSANRLGVEDPAPGEVKFFAVWAKIKIDDRETTDFHYIAKDYETIDFIP